jgi:hypothetical protein
MLTVIDSPLLLVTLDLGSNSIDSSDWDSFSVGLMALLLL